ncbi:genetic suppressor element 1-like isoform X2 [Brachyhypopomus gauderio]|uniref:genetic suppressor element 1-like isoform X2 n=1 Tax=Brachyhypopomus gauderio TaxID=698409 RepID=UPI004042C0B8
MFTLIKGMSHEPKSPSLGMISTATRTTATVSPLTPSPLNGSIVPNGSPAAQSAHSGFAAALRKLAKQAEEPRGKTRPHLLSGPGAVGLLLSRPRAAWSGESPIVWALRMTVVSVVQ